MKTSSFFLFVFAFLVSAVNAVQLPEPPSTPTSPLPEPTPRVARTNHSGSAPAISLVGEAADDQAPPEGLALQQLIVHNYASPLYRKPTERELAAIAPPSGIVNRYGDLLNGSNTGIFRLEPDYGCSTNTRVINANDKCLQYTMPGGGSSYSFRTGTYRIRELADLNYSKGLLGVTGLMMNGMIADLGNVPLEAVTLETRGVPFLAAFQPPRGFDEAQAANEKFIAGVTNEGTLYRRFLPASTDRTYVLRAVAYRGKVMRAARGVPYNIFDFDKRRDVIIAFRVALRDTDGSIIIVWKQLRSGESPKLILDHKQLTRPPGKAKG